MSAAREALFARLSISTFRREVITSMLDAYRAEVLREAAAKIRAEATKMDDPGPSQTIRRAGMRHAADLIDPDKT